MEKQIRELAASVNDRVVAYRRHFHMHPELSYQEKETQAFIQEELTMLGIPYTTVPDCYSVIGRLTGDKPGKTIAFRADIDALLVNEENDVPYKSQTPGVMHACGHDAHAAVLLGLAKIFASQRDRIQGSVVFIFQHAEEKLPGGARTLVEHGVMDDVDAVFAMHMHVLGEVGTVYYNEGALTASADNFDVVLKGAGGHAAEPHLCNDALLAGAILTQQLQTIVSRNVDPIDSAVLSVCQLHAGTTHNIIAETCRLAGTVRTLSETVRDAMEKRLHEVANAVAVAHGLGCDVQYVRGFPVTVCDGPLVAGVVKTLQENTTLQVKEMKPMLGGEDFAYFAQQTPGAYFMVGSGNAAKGIVHAHHSPHFDIDEEALSVALQVFLAAYVSTLD